MTNNDSDKELSNALESFSPPELNDDFYQRLDERVANEPTPKKNITPIIKRHWRSLGATAVAAAAALALIGSTVLTDTQHQPSPGLAEDSTTTSTSTPATEPPEEPFKPTLASQVLDRAEQRYATVQGISGISTQTEFCIKEPNEGNPTDCSQSPYPIKQVTSFRLRSNGDSWSSIITDEGQTAGAPEHRYPYVSNAGTTTSYDAKKNEGVSTSYWDFTTGDRTPALHYSKSVGQQYGMDVPYVFGHFTLQSLLDGLAFDQSSKLEDVIQDGRPAWKIQAKGLPLDAFGITPDEVIAYFDQETLFPLNVTEIRVGQVLKETKISDLKVNPNFAPTDFTIDIPKDADVNTTTGPWTSATLTSIASKVSYRPLVPTYLPEDFTLLDIRTAKDGGPSGAEGSNPDNRDVIALIYGRGLQRLTITTRLTGKGNEWIDPHSYEGETNSKPNEFAVQGGAYNGVKANLVTGFGTQPHVWIISATLVTTVIGDVSSAELQKVLGSLQRQ